MNNFIKHLNAFYVIPTLRFTYEVDWYLYIEISWLKWGLEFKIFDNSI